VSLPAPQAVEYCSKRAEVLRNKRAVLESRAEKLRWEAEQFEGALQEGGV
jgi:hypothetical protein